MTFTKDAPEFLTTQRKDEIGKYIRVEWSHYVTEKPLLIVDKLKEFLTDDQVFSVLRVIENTCHSCWDNERGCGCDNDR